MEISIKLFFIRYLSSAFCDIPFRNPRTTMLEHPPMHRGRWSGHLGLELSHAHLPVHREGPGIGGTSWCCWYGDGRSVVRGMRIHRLRMGEVGQGWLKTDGRSMKAWKKITVLWQEGQFSASGVAGLVPGSDLSEHHADLRHRLFTHHSSNPCKGLRILVNFRFQLKIFHPTAPPYLSNWAVFKPLIGRWFIGAYTVLTHQSTFYTSHHEMTITH